MLRKGIHDLPFNFSYQNKDNLDMLTQLAITIASIASKVPGGMLVFFPSYWMMEKCYNHWAATENLQKIDKHKKVFMEPKKASEYQIIMDRYYGEIFEEENGGAIMMGVCRGRISEGLDFSDNAARVVMVVGVPYPMMTDPKVLLKQ